MIEAVKALESKLNDLNLRMHALEHYLSTDYRTMMDNYYKMQFELAKKKRNDQIRKRKARRKRKTK